MKKGLIIGSIVCFVVLMACSDNKSTVKTTSVINPNGDSELALLMREMYDDGQRIKEQILAGEKPEILKRFAEIHTAEATEPEKAASDAYKMYADAFLNAMDILAESDESNVNLNYMAMVQSCNNCHQQLCPGPMVKIKKLNLPKNMY